MVRCLFPLVRIACRETPVPIPNTAVKPACADGTAGEPVGE